MEEAERQHEQMVRAIKRGNHGSAEKGEGNVSLEEIDTDKLMADLQEARDELQA